MQLLHLFFDGVAEPVPRNVILTEPVVTLVAAEHGRHWSPSPLGLFTPILLRNLSRNNIAAALFALLFSNATSLVTVGAGTAVLLFINCRYDKHISPRCFMGSTGHIYEAVIGLL